MKNSWILRDKKRSMFSAAIVVFPVLLSSCHKDLTSLHDTLTGSSIASAAVTATSNLIYEETFEGATTFSTYVSKQIGTEYGFTKVNSPVFEGKYAGRFELRDTDPITSGGTRTEVKFPELVNPNRWYSFSIYFPAGDYEYDSKAEIINQWHQGNGASPSISLITRYDRLQLETRNEPDVKERHDLGALVKNKWRTYVLHIIHSHGSDGLVEIWEDGKKIITRTGANSYDFASFDKPKWKLGIYKWEWNGDATTDTKKRVVFFDNIRLGNENASYADMVSSLTPVSPDPNPQDTVSTPPTPPVVPPAPPTEPTVPPSGSGAIQSFTLIDAATERDVVTLSEGATISLKKYNLTKANIRANLQSADKSVKFDLSGPQAYASKDSAFPFALFGDDGKGNYYYGNWKNPTPGNYVLKATPWSGAKATGTAGTTITLNFTITE